MKRSVQFTDTAYKSKGLFRAHTELIKLTVRTFYRQGMLMKRTVQCTDRAHITKGLFRVHTGLIK